MDQLRLISFSNLISINTMNRLYYLFFLHLLFPLASIHSQIDLYKLEIALNHASRTGQVIFLEEIAGLT